MCSDCSVLLCVVCFISGLVIRYVLVLISIVNLKLYVLWFAVGWRLGAVLWNSVRDAG